MTRPAQKAAADGKLRWSEAVVWDGDLNACRQGENAATRDCLRDAMRARQRRCDHRRRTAVHRGELAYVTAWHENEGLGIATVEYPFRANTNEGTRLVDATGKHRCGCRAAGRHLRADPPCRPC